MKTRVKRKDLIHEDTQYVTLLVRILMYIIYVLVDLSLFWQCCNQCLFGENQPFDKKE